MKRVGDLMPRIASLDNVILAAYRAQMGRRVRVRAPADVTEPLASALVAELADGSWRPSPYAHFVVHDPKRREIHAAPMRDRIAHHALMNVVGPVLERGATAHSYACRVGRGTHAALQHAVRCSRRFPWYLKLDVRRYFDSVSHDLLRTLLRRCLKDPQVLIFLDRIIESYSTAPGRGIPIGTLTSQHFANFYLDGLDHLVSERLGCHGYVRYMDDFILWSHDAARLQGLLEEVRLWLANERGLVLKDHATPRQSREGTPFLGYRVMPNGILLGSALRRRCVRRLRMAESEYLEGRLSAQQLQRRSDAVLAVARVARSASWRARTLASLPLAQEEA